MWESGGCGRPSSCLGATQLQAPAVSSSPCIRFASEAVLRPGGVGQHPTGRWRTPRAGEGGRAGPPPGGIGPVVPGPAIALHTSREPLPVQRVVVSASLVSSTLGVVASVGLPT